MYIEGRAGLSPENALSMSRLPVSGLFFFNRSLCFYCCWLRRMLLSTVSLFAL
jgi:hypothetical protein